MGKWLRSRRQRGTATGRRIWWVHHYGVSPDLPESLRYWELSTLLKQQGWDTTIFATAFNHKARRYVRPVSPTRPVLEQDEQGIRFVWLYTTPYEGNDWRRYLNMASFLPLMTVVGLFRKAPDIVIGTSPNMLAALAGWILARRHRVPFVLEIMDLWPESLVQLGLDNRPVISALEWLERFLYRRADLIIPLTEGIETGVLNKGFSHRPIVLIPNAASKPSPLDPVARERTREERGWDGKVVAVWIGAHGPANGLDVIIDAARLTSYIEELHYVFVGDGPEKSRLKQAAHDMANVQFMEPVGKEEVGELLRASDIGLLVHRDTEAVKGARPNKLFDYMAAGLPIVLNMDGEPRRLADEAGVGVYVPAEQAQPLADAIVRLYNDPWLRKVLGQSGFRHVSSAHSREDTAIILEQQLNHLVEGQEHSS